MYQPISPWLKVKDFALNAHGPIPFPEHGMAMRNQAAISVKIERPVFPENQR
jgi:hypothetical protein